MSDVLCPKCNKLMMNKYDDLGCNKCYILFYRYLHYSDNLLKKYYVYVGLDKYGAYSDATRIEAALSIKECLKLVKLKTFI